MTDSRIIKNIDGFLILMLLLFSVYYAAVNKNKGDAGIEENREEYLSETCKMTAFQKVTLGIPVDINRESVNGLTAIPGIGKSLARTIEDERVKRNGYKDINELKTLPGIGEKLFNKITPYIRI
ncbi:MAG: helix-hairpin-helix domain-containing protein [Deltaproteobacteria bacterium]|nr:helix-hairpin-helix domain-containing protein [Deltaproteobacteria bacterium]